MKYLFILCFTVTGLVSCASRQGADAEVMVDKKTIGLLPTEKEPDLHEVTQFKGVQVTGVTVTRTGRMFANFPRWRENVPYSVVEIMPDGTHKLYPDEAWNTWTGEPQKNRFTCVQSVYAFKDSLFVLDPSSPELKGVIGKAMLYEFDLATNQLKRSWSFSDAVAPEKSYLNDIRIDEKSGQAFITDSGLGGIVVLDLKRGTSKRVLDKHPSTKAENVILTVEKKKFLLPDGKRPQIHSDGIALSPGGEKLYYHALTGYHLYRVSTDAIVKQKRNETDLVKSVENLGVTPAADGMIFDKKGNLYMADLERNAISYRTPGGDMKILIQDERIKWPDSFAIDPENNLIFTDSLIQDAAFGEQVDDLTFKIYKVALPL